MDFITQYALGDDIAIITLVLLALSIAGIACGFVVPRRLERLHDQDELTPRMGANVGNVLGSTATVALWVGVPAIALMYLVPGSTEDKLLRSGMILLGVLVAAVASWRGMILHAAAVGLPDTAAQRHAPKLGALHVAHALSWAILPISITVWFLAGSSGIALLSLAGGAALWTVTQRFMAAPVETTAVAAVHMVGVDENEADPHDRDLRGGSLLRMSHLISNGAALTADVLTVTVSAAALAVLVGIQVIAGEAVLVMLLGIGIALLTAAITALIPQRGKDGRERTMFTLGGVLSTVLGVTGLVASAVLWLPSRYQALRFSQVGMGEFSDAAIAGPQPVPRADLEEQILTAGEEMTQWIQATDDSRDASAFLDVITLYGIDPSAVVGGAILAGAIAAFLALLMGRTLAGSDSGTAHRTARTHRTGGALGTIAGLASSALVAAGVGGAVIAVLTFLSVTSAGVPELAGALTAHAALGALVVLCGHTGALTASTYTATAAPAEPGTAIAFERDAAESAAAGPRLVMLMVAVFTAIAALSPVVTTLWLSPRGPAVWEDRSLHALSPAALPVVAGAITGAVLMLLLAASVLDALRRIGAWAVVETRAAAMDDRAEITMPEGYAAMRRALMTPTLVLLTVPVAVGFGLGAAALPGFIVGVTATAALLGWCLLAAAPALTSARDVIASGRYGGAGSWGHSGAISGAALGTFMRSALGNPAPAIVLTAVITTALITPAATLVVWNDSVNPVMRWLIAIGALALAAVAWVVSATADEVDLDDHVEDTARPLFARDEDDNTSDDLGAAMMWHSDEDDDAEGIESDQERSGRSSH